MRQIFRTAIAAAVLLLIIGTLSSVIAPSYFPFVVCSCEEVSEHDAHCTYNVVVTNRSLIPLEIEGIGVSCWCIDRPSTPFIVSKLSTKTLAFRVGEKQAYGRDKIVTFYACPPHKKFAVELKR